MSVRVMSWVFEHSQARDNSRLVALALADCAHDDGRCWPGIDLIVKKAKCSASTVKRATRRLVELGELIVTDRGRNTNVYRFTFETGCQLNLIPQASWPHNVVGSSATVVGSSALGCGVICDVKPRSSQRNASGISTLSVRNRKENRKKDTLGFSEFWESYPRKRHKPAALRAWGTVGGDGQRAAILAGLAAWCVSDSWARGFVEDASTFLNQRQWQDEPPLPTQRGDEGNTGEQHVEATRALLQQRGWL